MGAGLIVCKHLLCALFVFLCVGEPLLHAKRSQRTARATSYKYQE